MMLWLLCFFSFLWADQVLLPGPETSRTEYRAFLEAHSELTTPSRFYSKARPQRAAREKLIQSYSEAQVTYLSGDREAALAKFRAVVELVTVDDWAAQDREVFVLCFLRLAQLSLSDQERRQWLMSSATFAVESVDSSLFPPPLYREWQERTRSAPRLGIHFSGLGSEWNKILLNGVPCEKNPCSVPGGAGDASVRVTWLSDRWLPFSSVAPISQIARVVPARRPWLEGRCLEPVIAQEAHAHFAAAKPFFGLECEEKQGRSLALANLTPRPSSSPPFIVPPPAPGKPLYKSPWLWLGVGAVVAAIVANNSNKQEKEKQPVTTYGY